MAYHGENSQDQASPRSSISPDITAYNLADLDERTRGILEELDALTAPYTSLAREARTLFYARMGRYTGPNAQQEEVQDTINAQVADLTKQATDLGRYRRALVAKLPPHIQRLPRGNNLDTAVAELDMELLQIEEQKLIGFLGPILDLANRVDARLGRAQEDLTALQGSNTRSRLGATLETLRIALRDFQRSCKHHGGEGSKFINLELQRLDSILAGRTPSPPTDDDNDDDDDDEKEYGKNLMEGNPKGYAAFVPFTVPTDDKTVSMFRFEQSHPPSLRNLAEWLGIDDDVTVAMLLNTGPIQTAYAACRSEPGHSCAMNPEILKLCMPLMTYSSDTLRAWREQLGNKREDGLNFAAAQFAHRVVRYLEGESCDDVDWEPVSLRMHGLDDYKIAYSHWAVALQIFWFMEKAFCL
ncbi:hypothetical protein GGR50DRAFT_355311 [Xylaria sp. CBS 124048]|nr:hypothetical protein GGR50DRAFT_355311 [Xylaria sp. CBS 124048]